MPFKIVNNDIVAELPMGPESFVLVLAAHGNKLFQFWVRHPSGFIVGGIPQLSPDMTMFPDYIQRMVLTDTPLPDDPPVLHRREHMSWDEHQRFPHPRCGRIRTREKLVIQVPRPEESLMITFFLRRVVDVEIHNID